MRRTEGLLKTAGTVLALVSGRHHVVMELAPTVGGCWAWRCSCHTCGSVAGGFAPGRAEALAAARPFVGERDQHTFHLGGIGSEFAAWLAARGEPALRVWRGMSRLTLPPAVAGSGFTVATDASVLPGGVGAWAFVTDAGWSLARPLSSAHWGSSGVAELRAVAAAVARMPDGCSVTLLIDNEQVCDVVRTLRRLGQGGRRLSRVQLSRWTRIPEWVPLDVAGDIMQRLGSLSAIVQRVPSGKHPLNKVADGLARTALGRRPKRGALPPIEAIEETCFPGCTVRHWRNNGGMRKQRAVLLAAQAALLPLTPASR